MPASPLQPSNFPISSSNTLRFISSSPLELGELSPFASPQAHAHMAEEDDRGRVADEAPRKRRCYTRSEMEALRLLDSEQQQRWWNLIYQGLEPVVAREYEGLCGPKQQKWSDDRKQSSRWKKEGIVADGKPIGDGGKRTNVMDPRHLAACSNFADESDSMVTEESYHEEEDTDDDHDSIQRPAFLVEGEPDFESGPPEDGLEYLRRVRWEATQLPRVKVAMFDVNKCKEQTPYMPRIPDIAKCPESLLPVKDWVDVFLVDFAKLRQVFSQMDSLKEDRSICNSMAKDSSAASGDGLLHDVPTISTILAMNAVSRATMLRKRVNDLEDESTLSRSNCLWLFALCVAVDAPLDAEMCATMRCLLRKCSSLIASRSDRSDDEVAMLSILIVISGTYFRQSEKPST